jgi:DNA primase
LEKLQEGDQKRAFAELQIRVQKLGVAGLTPEEKQAYIRLSNREKRS